jgi:hypothetical protein
VGVIAWVRQDPLILTGEAAKHMVAPFLELQTHLFGPLPLFFLFTSTNQYSTTLLQKPLLSTLVPTPRSAHALISLLPFPSFSSAFSLLSTLGRPALLCSALSSHNPIASAPPFGERKSTTSFPLRTC